MPESRSRPTRPHRTLIALLSAALLAATACSSAAAPGSHGPAQTQTITDIAGRKVTVPVPSRIHRIVMVGAPPAIDGFVIAVGAGNLIVNGVPKVFSAAHFGWKILEPRLVNGNSSSRRLDPTTSASRGPSRPNC